MKVAVISDIHGNPQAFDNFLKIMDEEGIEKIICLGDIIGIGPHPDECVKRIIKLGKRLICCVRGNHEDRFLFGIPEFIHDNKRRMTEEEIIQENWVKNQISEESRSFISSLNQEELIEIDGIKIQVMHYPSSENMEYKRFNYHPTMEDCQTLFEKYSADVMLFGHTHTDFINHKYDTWYINPGSLGTTSYRSYSTFGILNIENGHISYEQRPNLFDLNSFIKEVNAVRYPRFDIMKKLFYGER